MSATYRDAIQVLLAGLADPVHDPGEVPNMAPLPYHVLYVSPGLDVSDTIAAVPTRAEGFFQLTSVGATVAAVDVVGNQAHQAVIGRKLLVDGRSCSRIRQVAARLPTPDDDVDPPVLYVVRQYAFISTPISVPG